MITGIATFTIDRSTMIIATPRLSIASPSHRFRVSAVMDELLGWLRVSGRLRSVRIAVSVGFVAQRIPYASNVDSEGMERKARLRSRPVTRDALDVGGLLLRIYGAASRTDQVDAEMSPHAVRAAIHLTTHGEATVGSLADGLGISQGWASRIAEEMERAGHLVRARDPMDRRVVRLRLSPSAVRAMERTSNWRGVAVERALEPCTPAERLAIREFLDRVATEMEQARSAR
jgi:DNA-binding MarR family transcriptional regulator